MSAHVKVFFSYSKSDAGKKTVLANCSDPGLDNVHMLNAAW